MVNRHNDGTLLREEALEIQKKKNKTMDAMSCIINKNSESFTFLK